MNRLDHADPEHWLMHADPDPDYPDETYWGEVCVCEIGHDHWAEA